MQCPACGKEAMTFKSIDKTIGQGAMAVPLTGLKAHVCAACGGIRVGCTQLPSLGCGPRSIRRRRARR
jgi:YgiT-type zinc finger domain-containing protein